MRKGFGRTAEACRTVGQAGRIADCGRPDSGGRSRFGTSLATDGTQAEWFASQTSLGALPPNSNQQLRHLRTLLRHGAVVHGWPNQLWTALRVTLLIERHFGIKYHPEHVRKLLKQRLHWTSQKPQKRAREEREGGGALDCRELAASASSSRSAACPDRAAGRIGLFARPSVRRTMSPRGQTPIMECSERRDRISVISAITLTPLALHVGLHFMLLGDNENFHGEEVVLFLRQLKAEVAGAWTIVWDRNQIHSKSRVVRAWLAKHPEVVAEDFPAYAPDTNPDESVWSWTKYGRLCNLASADIDELRKHIWNALTALEHQPQLLKSFFIHAKLPLLT